MISAASQCAIGTGTVIDYMAACALEFESGEIGVYQILASKRAVGSTAMPLTRQHIYDARHAVPSARLGTGAGTRPDGRDGHGANPPFSG